MSERITGAEALIKSLIAENIDTVFGYPGGAIIPVYDKLYDYTATLTHILTRHEQGAAHAAQGYARASGRPAVVIVTSGPGAANIITGLSDAMMDSTPVIFITGQVQSSLLGCDAFQETDVVGVTQPISKWAYQIRRPEDIAQAVARAFYIATTGRPGPVVLDLTKDAQTGLTTWDGYRKCNYIRSYQPDPQLHDTDLQRVAGMINRSCRPMILSGQGVTISGAETELARLAEKADIPVASTLLGLSAMPSGHRLFKGMLGMHGNIGPNVNTNRADLIIAVGMRFDDRVTGDVNAYAPLAKIVHIDIDASEFGKNIRVDATLHADARAALAALMPLVDEARHDEWLASFEKAELAERSQVMDGELHRQSGPMTMGEVAAKVSEAAGHDAILVTDVGQNQMMSARYFRFTRPRSIITSGGLGTM
ncbi:MAG: acetolactate synthase large subunit, partial [Muribaculaceae bacterium]|nr:acetolactate synthase large subunit [Muribaculaceae bacterium]